MAKATNSSSAFNPDIFLNQEVVGANETKYTAIPVGEYKSFIEDLGTDSYEDRPILIVTHAILDESGELKAKLGLEKPTVQDRIFLDVMEDGVTLAFGPNKNIRLGRLREAVGQNDPKKKWNFNMLRNQGPISIMVEHNWREKNGVKEGPFANITRVARAS